jgi:hypothetical protein
MKIKILKLAVIVLILAGSFACEEDAISDNNFSFQNCRESIIGKWKLEYSVDYADYTSPDTVLYVEHNIVFEFLSENKFIVTGQNCITQEGNHSYLYSLPPEPNPLSLWDGNNLNIDCKMADELLVCAKRMSLMSNSAGDKISINPDIFSNSRVSYYFNLMPNK